MVVTFKVSAALTVSMKSNSSAVVSCFFANPRFTKGRQSLKSHYSHLNCFPVSLCPDQYRLAIVPRDRADTNLANLPKLPGLFFCILRWKLHSIPRKQKKITALTSLCHPKVQMQRQPYRAILPVDVWINSYWLLSYSKEIYLLWLIIIYFKNSQNNSIWFYSSDERMNQIENSACYIIWMLHALKSDSVKLETHSHSHAHSNHVIEMYLHRGQVQCDYSMQWPSFKRTAL